jgi:hypothetical protein
MDIAEQIKKNRESFEREAKWIREDTDLTAEAKARRIRPIFEEAKRTESQLRAQRRADLAARVNAAEREVFKAPPMFSSDPALVQMNYRHALESVASVTDARDLSEMLDRANLTGDKTLAKAVGWRANELQAEGVVQKWVGSDPEVAEKFGSWVEAYDELGRVNSVGEELVYGEIPLQEPEELGGEPQERRRREASGLDTVLNQAMQTQDA